MIVRKEWLLIFLLAIAFLVRFIQINAHGLWFDEILSVTSAKGFSLSVPAVAEGQSFTGEDLSQHNTLTNVRQAVIYQDSGNAIVYNLFLHFWIKLFGSSDTVVRFLSLLCGLVSVLLVYMICAAVFTGNVAWWASGFAALHPLLIRYSQEARTYAFATMLSLLGTLIFVWLIKDGKRRWQLSLFYGLTAGLAMLAHYLTGYVFIAHGIFVLLYVRDRKCWVRLIVSGLLAIAIWGAWQFNGGREGMQRLQAANQNYGEMAATTSSEKKFATPFAPRYISAGFLQVTYAMSGNSLQTGGLQLRSLLPFLILPGAFLILSWQARNRCEGFEGAYLLILLLAVSGISCSLILAVIAGHMISFQLAYATFATPYFAILIGLGMSQVFSTGKRWGWLLKGLVVAQGIVIGLSIYLIYTDSSWQRPPNQYAMIANRITENAVSGETVIYPSWVDALLSNLYLPPSTTVTQKIDASFTGNDIIVLHAADPPLKIASPKEYWLNLHKDEKTPYIK